MAGERRAFAAGIRECRSWTSDREHVLNGALQIANGEWSVILRILPVFEELHDDVRATLIPQLLPAISDVSV